MLSRLRGRLALGWPDFRSLRGWYAVSLTAILLGLALITGALAQSPRRSVPPPPPATPLQTATRALLEGRFDDVATLTAKLDAQDPNVIALRARALAARGQYQQAEELLRPAAERAPTSEAALQLGLLLDMLGRDEAERVLTPVARIAERATGGAELARAARALQAIGNFQEAKRFRPRGAICSSRSTTSRKRSRATKRRCARIRSTALPSSGWPGRWRTKSRPTPRPWPSRRLA
jgi:tetratricopeptide (TPR) repeat protein